MTPQEIVDKTDSMMVFLDSKGFIEGDTSKDNIIKLLNACKYFELDKQQIDILLRHNKTNGWEAITGKLIIRDGKMYEE